MDIGRGWDWIIHHHRKPFFRHWLDWLVDNDDVDSDDVGNNDDGVNDDDDDDDDGTIFEYLQILFIEKELGEKQGEQQGKS